MQIFTDASFDEKKNLAGIGCVLVDGKTEIARCSSFLCGRTIHLAELCALAYGVMMGATSGAKEVRIVSDSASALSALDLFVRCHRHTHNLTQKEYIFLRKLDLMTEQKAVLEAMRDMFMRSKVRFSFCHTYGHQKNPAQASDGYWNHYADKAAKEGRCIGGGGVTEVDKVRSLEEFLAIIDTKCTGNQTCKNWSKRVVVDTQQKQCKSPKNVTCPKGKYRVIFDGVIEFQILEKVHE